MTYAPGCVVDDENGKVSSNGIYYTGPDGTITINGIVGTVVVTEQATIPGYTIDPATQSQTIVVNPDDVQHAYFYNSPKNTLKLLCSAIPQLNSPTFPKVLIHSSYPCTW